MLFDSSLRKELGRTFGASLVVLITIVVTVMLIRMLGQASVGRIDPAEVMLVMGYTVLGHLPTILTLSLFVAVTATLTRMYAASEMVVWFSSGHGLLAFLKPLLRFAWPVLMAVAVLALVVWPWSNRQIRELRDRFQGRGDIERVAPGRFIESAGGSRVFFIDRDAPGDERGSNIFVADSQRGKDTVTSAHTGRIDVLHGERFIVLQDGYRLETETATGDMRVSEFSQYGHRITTRAAAATTNDSPRLKPTPVLLADPSRRNLAEMSWRLGLTFAALNCVVIALAATRVNPRVGRSGGLLFALFAFATYYNLIGVGESWIGHGRVGLLPLLLGLHGGVLALALGWLWLRHNGAGLLRPRRALAAS